jgi:hypothetical protein
MSTVKLVRSYNSLTIEADCHRRLPIRFTKVNHRLRNEYSHYIALRRAVSFFLARKNGFTSSFTRRALNENMRGPPNNAVTSPQISTVALFLFYARKVKSCRGIQMN